MFGSAVSHAEGEDDAMEVLWENADDEFQVLEFAEIGHASAGEDCVALHINLITFARCGDTDQRDRVPLILTRNGGEKADGGFLPFCPKRKEGEEAFVCIQVA